MSLYDSRGHSIRLGKELGRGGEGAVWELPALPGMVAKTYHKGIDAHKAAKLAAMVRLRTDRLLNLAAWPVDLLLDRPGGSVRGLVMPRVSGPKEIHALYSPKSRRSEFSKATWPFLIHAAANTARAFAVIHEHGHVIGDVNEKNLVVSDEALVKFIDCDSFQVSQNGQRFLCEVGVPLFTPPELQGKPFRGVVRTPDHDAFGLAILVFLLLFMGRHPFSGAFLGSGHMPLEKAIEEFRFAYGPGAAARQMKQPPGTLDLAAVSQPVALLFQRAFSPDGARPGVRPTAREWETALGALARQLAQCNRSPAHQYLSSLSTCPWCQIEALSGIQLFTIVLRATRQAPGGFKLEAVWAQIAAVPGPGQLPNLPQPVVNPSPQALEWSQAKKTRNLLAVGFGVALVGCILGLAVLPAASCVLFIAAVFLGMASQAASPGKARQQTAAVLQDAQTRWGHISQRWQAEASEARFHAKLQELQAVRQAYLNLPAVRQQKQQQLLTTLEQRQRQQFLDRYRIWSSNVTGIGPGRTAILQSYGIETAADVEYNAIMAVPGFGPTLTSNLVYWRRSVESRFRFDPSRGVDPADQAALDAEIAAMQARMEQELLNAPAVLRQIAQQSLASRDALRPHLEQALREVWQAQADLSVL